MKQLALGVPKGSLQESTIRLFRQSGWKISLSDRNYFPEINDSDINCSICRAQEMSRYVESGTFDVGLTGRDWIMENDSDVIVVTDLVYSKVSQRPARWVLAVPMDSPVRDLQDLQGKKIATELVNFTRRYFETEGVKVNVEFSWGATEAKVISGLCDAIVEVTETGATMRANGLRIVKELMQSNTQLIANRQAWEDPWKRAKIEHISLLLQGALRAEDLVALKMNVPEEKLNEVIKLLPSLNAPTIAHLYMSTWLSVETVVSKNIVRELIPRLIQGGAEGIIEYSLNKVI
ncbi:ATP phosphoribosyltransferase [Syntrophobacter fumaroxidans]|uniref:ATP phosphoribosyltransferase n=1 Tax=Syntrophobacter fumaroxidans (strain DSM 10017 / MPOB) TaxID=335543 RepID=A0LQL9_SYNFM|nr:ATP phosphoribosyltransferase [Syntrophobacter fumaroxidans]ABK19721.1 ATP phosphoribosyltransferase (homohexameric) [Syntrophobacter fumaroxidans MPOB]